MGDAMRMALEDSGPPITPVPSAGQLVQDDPPSLSASPPEGGIHPAPARQSRLAIAHPCEREGEVTFFGGKEHRYVDAGAKEVPRSVTDYTKKYFDDFNAEEMVKQYFPRWDANKLNKYNPLIQYLRLVNGLDDVAIKAEILRLWEANGKKAADEGTAVHEEMQCIAEEWMMPEPPSTAAAMGKTWLLHFCKENHLRVFRSEFLMVYRATLPSGEEVPVVAGQADLILQSTVLGKEKEFTIVDWKTTNPAPKVEGGPKTLIGAKLEHPPRFTDKYAPWPFTEFVRDKDRMYAAQLNIYEHILRTQYGMDARGRLWVVQLNKDLGSARCVKMPPMETAVQTLLEHEAKNAVDAYA